MSRLWACLAVVLLVALQACTSQRSGAAGGAAPPAAGPTVPAAGRTAAPSAGEAALRTGGHGGRTASTQWRLVYSTDFPVDAKLGSFSGCQLSTHTCTGLPQALQSQWWAYPDGRPDTATNRNLKVGGYFTPSSTVWIAGGAMNIRLWRGTGSVHSAALLPKAAIGRTYGKYVETFRVADPVLGYKSAHLLWAIKAPTDGSAHEIDFPEDGWGTPIKAYIHYPHSRSWFNAGTDFNRTWHTTVIEWTPHGLSLYCDGRLVGSIHRNVSDVPMQWVLQNATQTNGTIPPPNSSSTMQIKYVAYYSWAG